MKRFATLCFVATAALCCVTPSAQALAPFKKAFQEKYVDPSDNEDLKAAFKTASCNTCHVKGEKKEVRNDYGEELAKLIEGDANARIKEAGAAGREAAQEEILKELDEAFKKVEKMKSKSGETYGDIIKSGKLPVPAE